MTSPLPYPQLGVPFRPIPKGLSPPAQGCKARATLGVAKKKVPTPTGLCPACRDQVATPLGLRAVPARFPRVARASQPWALGQNPVGIQSLGNGKLWVRQRTAYRYSTIATPRTDATPFPSSSAPSPPWAPPIAPHQTSGRKLESNAATPTARKIVTIVHHPNPRFRFIPHTADSHHPVWPDILGTFSLDAPQDAF